LSGALGTFHRCLITESQRPRDRAAEPRVPGAVRP